MKIMKHIFAAIIFILASCSGRNSNTNTTLTTNKVEPNSFNVIDSLQRVEGLTELETRIYTTQDGAELTIYNYKHSGDGVYELNGSNHGRLYTLRGDAQNPNAVVYQLVPFNGGEMTNLLYQGDTLLLLNDKFEQPQPPTVHDIYSQR